MINGKHQKKNMLIKLTAAAVMVMLSLSLFSRPGLAVELDSGAQPCTVTVASSAAIVIDSISVEQVSLDFYEIAKAVVQTDPSGSEYDSYEFSYLTPFDADPTLQIESIVKKAKEEQRDITAEEIDKITQDIARKILVDGNEGTKVGTGSMDEKYTLPEAGLYLIVPHGNDMEKSEYLKDEDGYISLISDAGDKLLTFAPILISLPNRGMENIGEGVIAGNTEWVYPIDLGDTTAAGEWAYDMEVTAKVGITDLMIGKLKLTKWLTNHENVSGRDDPSTFVFTVEVTKGGKSYYSNVHSFVFTKYGSDTVTIENLPIGGTATITEVYSGGNYDPDQKVITVPIIEDDPETENIEEMAEAEFTNTWNDTVPGTGSVINHISADEHGWSAPESAKQYSDGHKKDLNEDDFTESD